MTKKHYWLVAGIVVTRNKTGVENTFRANVMIFTTEQQIVRADLAKAQDAMLQRFVKEAPQPKGFQISDAFIMSTNHLGYMDDATFNAGFENQPAENLQAEMEMH